MRPRQVMLIVLAAGASLAGCSGAENSNVTVRKQLTVTGRPDDVERFAGLQGSLRPALAVSAIKPLGGGRAEAVVTLPARFKGSDLVYTAREAVAANLSYKYEEHHYATAKKS